MGRRIPKRMWKRCSFLQHLIGGYLLRTRVIQMFEHVTGDWTKLRDVPGLVEVDFHWSEYGRPQLPYWERMEEVREVAYNALEQAYNSGDKFVLFTHGWSTSRPGKTSARSQVRTLMRSKGSTPFVIKSKSKQHDSVFLAAIRPRGV